MAFAPGTAASVVTQLELTISCRNLHDADVYSNSNPMVVIEQLVRELALKFSFMFSNKEKVFFFTESDPH